MRTSIFTFNNSQQNLTKYLNTVLEKEKGSSLYFFVLYMLKKANLKMQNFLIQKYN